MIESRQRSGTQPTRLQLLFNESQSRIIIS